MYPLQSPAACLTDLMESCAAASEGEGHAGPSRSVEGTLIRMMPEYGIEIPLWDRGGPLEEREVLEGALGLSSSLIDALAQWQAEWDDVHSAAVSDDTVPVKPLPPGWARDHRSRGRDLFSRLQGEVNPQFEVRLHS